LLGQRDPHRRRRGLKLVFRRPRERSFAQANRITLANLCRRKGPGQREALGDSAIHGQPGPAAFHPSSDGHCCYTAPDHAAPCCLKSHFPTRGVGVAQPTPPCWVRSGRVRRSQPPVRLSDLCGCCPRRSIFKMLDVSRHESVASLGGKGRSPPTQPSCWQTSSMLADLVHGGLATIHDERVSVGERRDRGRPRADHGSRSERNRGSATRTPMSGHAVPALPWKSPPKGRGLRCDRRSGTPKHARLRVGFMTRRTATPPAAACSQTTTDTPRQSIQAPARLAAFFRLDR
jgi:hypothetical protein